MTQADARLGDVTPLQPYVLDEHRTMVGDLVIDHALGTIHSNSMRSVKLSGNELTILITLARAAGRFVSREDLLIAVTGSADGAHHSVIDTYGTYLHRQLQNADSAATIEKSRDLGFRLHP